MRADMKKKAKKAKGFNVEIMDVSEHEKHIGQKVDDYKQKKEL